MYIWPGSVPAATAAGQDLAIDRANTPEVPPCIGGICHGGNPRAARGVADDRQASIKQALTDSQLLGMNNAFINPEAL